MGKTIGLLLPLALAGCQTWGPTWSELSGQRYHKAIEDRRPVEIVAIGDQRVFSPPFKVEPGRYIIVLESPQHRGFRGTQQAISIRLAPCRRYYVNAQFKNPLEPDWYPVIDYVEDIAGCKPATVAK
jgi:hypothetical protein